MERLKIKEVDNMSESEKFINIRDEFSKKIEPLTIKSEKACWDFYINSTSENQSTLQESEDKLYSLYKDIDTYKKLQSIDKTKLSEHEAKQLKKLLKKFDEEITSGEAKKELRKKEAEISQKYNTYVPVIDGKEVTKVDISNIIQTEQNPKIREKAYNAKIAGGNLIADDLIELIKMRNEYSKRKGYENYFNYMIQEEYDVNPKILDKLMDEVYSKSKDKINNIQRQNEQELKQIFNIAELKAYHWGLIPKSNPDKEVNEIIAKYNIESIAKNTYKGMGYDLDSLIRKRALTLDLYPRKGKNTHGFCFCIEAGKDSRILANLCNNVDSLNTIHHELGHSVYDLGISSTLPFIDRQPSSSAITEAIAMMMGDIIKKENILNDILPESLLIKFKESLREDEAKFISRSMLIIDFERELYKNPKQNRAELWSKLKAKYTGRIEEPDNEWATIPHYLSHPGYYQNYFRATLMKAQIYNHLNKVLGNITENKTSANYMKKNIFSLGASIEECQLIKILTGKELSSDDFIADLN